MAARINPATVVNARAMNLTDIFGGPSYRIPAYQREYVWKNQHVEVLWRDLVDHYEANTTHDDLDTNPDGYFLGALMVIPSSAANNEFDVIDGQQRLTTLSVLLSVISEHLCLIADPGQRKGYDRNLANLLARFSSGQWLPAVRSHSADVEWFLGQLTGELMSAAERLSFFDSNPRAVALLKSDKMALRIRETVELLEKRIEEFVFSPAATSDKDKRVRALVDMLLETVILLRIDAGSESACYTLFESMNNRGVSLSQSDLIKNHALRVAAPVSSVLIAVQDGWSDLKAVVDGQDKLTAPEIMHYSQISRHQYCQASRLFSVVSSRLNAPTVAASYIGELNEDSDALEKLLTGDSSAWSEKTNRSLKWIGEVLGIKLAYAFLLSCYKVNAKDRSRFEKCVVDVEHFCFRYMKLLEGDVADLAEAAGKYAELLRSDPTGVAGAAHLASLVPNVECQTAFSSLSVTNSKLGFYVIYKIEESLLAKGGSLPLSQAAFNDLEHIAPKTPKAEDWPNMSLLKSADPDRYKRLIWRVGNLLAIPAKTNRGLKNKGISEKLTGNKGKNYASSTLGLPGEVDGFLDSGHWTEQSIEDRQRYLATSYFGPAWSL
ncbi:conserved hypothetical protein [gamma proteobacterium NOR5-3]|nr:conserved hypothetical protein [gamma proteobacterium NOR5-3]